MKKLLTALLAAGFVAGYASSGFACAFHSAEVEKQLTLAQSEQPVVEDEAAMSTHDPDAVKIEEKVETE